VTVVLLSLAGGLGAVCRLVVDGAVRARWGRGPYGTLVINVGGSLLLGLLSGLVLFHGVPPAWRSVLGTGFCGGYTTFSTASFETVRLIQERRPVAAVLNGAGSLVLTVLAGGLGLLLAGAATR